MDFLDNVVHYNWHWRWHWGTGEAGNNAVHPVDLLRWGLGVDYPVSVSSQGGRFRYDDDWETPDTQIISWDFEGDVAMAFEGRSCNGRTVEGTPVGAMFYGEKGSLLLDRNSYKIFDLKNNVIREAGGDQGNNEVDRVDPSASLDLGPRQSHIQNFLEAISKGTSLFSPIDSGHKSTLLVQLANISYRVGRTIKIDNKTGHILDDREASGLWARQYEKGWEMVL
jgi:predicted dehydrogenase